MVGRAARSLREQGLRETLYAVWDFFGYRRDRLIGDRVDRRYGTDTSAPGRGALLLAAEYPFRRIVGVEFAPELHEIALANVGRFVSRRRDARFELRLGDAATIDLPQEPLAIFLYNPSRSASCARSSRASRRASGSVPVTSSSSTAIRSTWS